MKQQDTNNQRQMDKMFNRLVETKSKSKPIYTWENMKEIRAEGVEQGKLSERERAIKIILKEFSYFDRGLMLMNMKTKRMIRLEDIMNEPKHNIIKALKQEGTK